MSDRMVDALVRSQKILESLENEKVIMLALSELMAEMATDREAPPGLRAKRMGLASSLAGRAGVKF